MSQPGSEDFINGAVDQKKLAEEIQEIKLLLKQKFSSDVSSASATSPELRQLLQQNLDASKEIYQLAKKIKRWTNWQTAWGGLKVLIILVPLILGLIFLPALLKPVIEPYQQLFNPSADGQSGGLGVQDLIKQFIDKSGNEQNKSVQ